MVRHAQFPCTSPRSNVRLRAEQVGSEDVIATAGVVVLDR
jgi:hypothetical protein